MLGLKRRTRVEGWALDTSDNDEAGGKSTLQRLGDNNKLWVIALVAVVVISSLVMRQAKDVSSRKKDDLYRPPAARRTGAFSNQDHRAFTAEFIKEKARPGTIVEARFTDDRTFRLVVAGDVSADDIEYNSWMAAQRILRTFKHRIVVQAYQRSAAAGTDVLRASTDWDVSKHGFIVKFVQKSK